MMRTTRTQLAGAGVLACALFAAGCAHGPTQPFVCQFPPQFHVTLDASQRVNPDEDGNALPTVVEVLQLSSTTRVGNAGFNDLWKQSQKVLGSDLVREDELTIDPGQTSGTWLERAPTTKFVVAVALFRQPSDGRWRTAVKLAPVTSDECPDQAMQGRTGDPGESDLDLRFHLEDFRIEAVSAARVRADR